MPIGQRQVVDLLLEISNHLVEPYLLTVLTAAVPAAPSPGPSTVIPITSALPLSDYLYPGALVVVGWQSPDAEVVTVISVFSAYFVANTVSAHSPGEQVLAATLPTQQPTDPIFTQSEIIGYIAQAQNELLTKVPLILQLFPLQELLIGQPYQTLPPTAIELERVAIQSLQFVNLVSIYRQAGIVWATTAVDVTLPPYSFTAGLPIQIFGVSDPSFDSAGGATFTLISATTEQPGSPYGGGGYGSGGYGGPSGAATIGWAQSGADVLPLLNTGQVGVSVLTRLYESSQETLSMNQPNWSSQGPQPLQWYEDRTGIYGWGVAPPPQGNYFVELLCSVRGSESLGLLSGFMVPDACVVYIKYKALEYAWTKDGVQRSPSMARYCKGRFDFGVMLLDRFLKNVVEKVGKAGAAAGGMF